MIPLPTVLNSLIRKRRLQHRFGSAVTTDVYEIFSVAGGPAPHFYTTAPSLKIALKTAQTAITQNGQVVSIFSPFRGHIFQAAIVDGHYAVLHGQVVVGYFDTPDEVVDELVRYIATTPALATTLQLVHRNMADLKAKGVYDSQNAVKAFLPIADDAVARYDEQYGGTQQEQYPHDIRRMTAERLTSLFEQEYKDDPSAIVEELSATQPEQVINLSDDPDGKNIIINVY